MTHGFYVKTYVLARTIKTEYLSVKLMAQILLFAEKKKGYRDNSILQNFQYTNT